MQSVIERVSALATDAETVWAWVTTPDGVNDELGPWIRMTVPAGWVQTSIADIEPGTHLGKSWLLFLGVVPFDCDDMTIAEIDGRRFLERSRLLSASFWQHEREVVSTEAGSIVRDTVTFESRQVLRWVPGGCRIHAAILGAIFSGRHRRLLARFGRAE